MTDDRRLLRLFIVTVTSWVVLVSELSFGRDKYDFVEPENTSIQVILFPSKETITASDTLLIRVLLLNTGDRNLILADIWEDDSLNVSFSFTDRQGKKVEFLDDKNAGSCLLVARNPWASSLILGVQQFWGFTLGFPGKLFPKSGNYYFQVTYRGTSPEFIEQLIQNRFIKPSRIEAPFNKYWHGEVKSNRIKIVVKK